MSRNSTKPKPNRTARRRDQFAGSAPSTAAPAVPIITPYHPLPASTPICLSSTVTLTRTRWTGCGKMMLFYTCSVHPDEGGWGCPDLRDEPSVPGCRVKVY